MFTTILAQGDSAPQNPPPENPLGIFGSPFLIIGLMLLFFFVVMWPAQRRAKREQANMLAGIKPGSKVVLSSGIVGAVVKVHETEGELTIRSDDTRIRVLRTAVVTVRGDEPAEVKA